MTHPRPFVLVLALASACIANKSSTPAPPLEPQAQAAIDTATTPDAKLAQLLAHYPELRPRVRVVHLTQARADTVVIPAAQAQVSLAPAPPAADVATVDSLLRGLQQVQGQIGQARATIRRGLLKELAQRPKFGTDTARVISDGLLLEAWQGPDGRIYARALRGSQPVAIKAEPQGPGRWLSQQLGKLWQLVGGSSYWVLALLGLVALVATIVSIKGKKKK